MSSDANFEFLKLEISRKFSMSMNRVKMNQYDNDSFEFLVCFEMATVNFQWRTFSFRIFFSFDSSQNTPLILWRKLRVFVRNTEWDWWSKYLSVFGIWNKLHRYSLKSQLMQIFLFNHRGTRILCCLLIVATKHGDAVFCSTRHEN